MADIKIAYASTTTAVAMTVGLTSLGNNSSRESTAVDNTSNKYLDAIVRVKTKGQSGSTSVVNVYAYGSSEGTSPVYTDSATGSDAAITSLLNAKLIGQIVMNGTTSVVAGPFSVAKAFDGQLPPKWGLIFENKSGAALSATGADHEVVFQGVYVTVT